MEPQPSTSGCTQDQSSQQTGLELTGDRPSYPKPSLADQLESIDDFVAKYRLVSSIGHISSFLKTSRPTVKLACLRALMSNYENKGALKSAERLMKVLPNITAAMSWIKDIFTGLFDSSADAQERLDAQSRIQGAGNTLDQLSEVIAKQEAAFQDYKEDFDLFVDPMRPIEEQPIALAILEEHMHIVRPLLGVAALFVVSTGMSQLLSLKWFSTASKEMIQLANTIKAHKVVKQEVDAGIDSILGAVYNMFGATYIEPKLASLHKLAKNVTTLQARTNAFVDGAKTDAFGIIRNEKVAGLTRLYEQYSLELAKYSENEKSNFNFRDKLYQIHQNLETIRARRLALIKGGSKQEPVKLWMYGKPGVGKSFLANRIAVRIAGGNSVYTRQSADKHWNTYIGQACTIFDDILQNPLSEDASEWMMFATTAAKDVPMAELNDKGIPFMSRFMIATSNYPAIVAHPNVSSLSAFDRRRDYVVYVYNDDAVRYRNENNAAAPPKEFYTAHPTRYFLFNPTLKHGNIASHYLTTGIPTVATPGYIGEVTEDELCIMLTQRELSYAEEYRLSLVQRGLGAVVRIPEPIEFDPRRYDVSRIFDRVTKHMNYDLNHPEAEVVRAPPEPDEVSVASAITNDSVLARPQIQLKPATVVRQQLRAALILVGRPGIGKTTLVETTLDAHEIPTYRVKPTDYATEDFVQTVQGDHVIFFDDITTSTSSYDAFSELLLMYERSELNCRGLVATVNPNTKLWKKNDASIQRAVRRSYVITLSMPTAYLASTLSVQEYLKSRGRNCIHFKVSAPHGFAKDAFTNLATFAVDFKRFLSLSLGSGAISHKAFSIPLPPDYDVLVGMPIEYLEIMGRPPLEILELVKQGTVYRRNSAYDLEQASFSEVLAVLCKLAPLFITTKAYGSAEEFVQIFNSETNTTNIDYHILVSFKDQHLGFVPVEGRVISYVVDREASTTDIRTLEEKILFKNREVKYDEHNEVFKKALARAFSRSPAPVYEISDEDLTTARKALLRSTPFGEFLSSFIPALSLFISSASAYAFISSISDNECSNCAEIHQERKKNYAQQDEQADSEKGKKTNENSSNNVQTERKKHYAQQDEQADSEKGKKTNDSPSNNVQTERKKHYAQQDEQADSEKGKKTNDSPSTSVHTEASLDMGYSQIRLKKQGIKIVDECVTQDGVLVIDDQDSFGFTYDGGVVYAHEHVRGTWTILRVPSSEKWRKVDMVAMAGKYSFGRSYKNVTFHRGKLSFNAVTESIGKQVLFPPTDEMDFGCVFACMNVFGIPADIEARRLYPDRVISLYNKLQCVNPPAQLVSYLKGVFPKHWREISDLKFIQEGCYDPTLRAVVDRLPDILQSIESDQGHALFGMFVGGRYLLTVAHLQKVSDPFITVGGEKYPLRYVESNPRADLALYEVVSPRFPAKRDVTHLFISRKNLQELFNKNLRDIPGYFYVGANEDRKTPIATNCTISALVKRNDPKDSEGQNVHYKATLGSLLLSGVSMEGDCGCPVLVQNRTFDGKILALHHSGNISVSIGSVITSDWLREIMNRPKALLECKTTDRLTTIKTDTSLILHEQAVQCPRTDLLNVGHIQKPVYVPTTTRIVRSGIELPGYDDYEPAIMDGADPRADGFDPVGEGLKRYGQHNIAGEIDRSRVEVAMACIGNEYASHIQTQNLTTRTFTKTEAVNTPSFVEYPNANPIDRSGSSGFPFIQLGGGTSKRNFLHYNENTGNWYFNTDIDAQHLSSRIDLIIANAKRQVEMLHPFIAYPKDESLKLKKIYKTKKTRLFFSGPFDYLIAFRMYFLSGMLRCMQMWRNVPAKVGISSNFADWHHLTSQLLAISPYGFASDVENFDSGVPKVFLESTKIVHNTVYSRCSLADDDVSTSETIRNVIHRAIEGAYVISRSKVYKLQQAQVSGNPATALENSWILWALYYLVWQDLANIHDPTVASYEKFRQYVGLAIYGDDNVCTVDPAFPWFNFNSFQREAAKYGFKITDALKLGGDVPDYQPLHELEFLKRSFKEIQGLYVGPLALSSIAKSILWIREESYAIKPYHVPALGGRWPLAGAKDTIGKNLDALWPELALHGKDVYQQWINILLPQLGPLHISSTPPLWVDAMKIKGYNVY